MLAIDKALFRLAAGSFATGVTVITTGRDGAYHGMTASAFASLSLEPPQVLVCVDRQADTYPLLEATGAFNVNILSASQEHLSRLFATKDASARHTLEGVAYSLGVLGVPVLEEALASIECRVVRQYDGGDHGIFVGEVENAVITEATEPLLYFRGRYRSLEALE